MRSICLLVALLLVVTACSDSATDPVEVTGTTTATTTTTTATTTTAETTATTTTTTATTTTTETTAETTAETMDTAATRGIPYTVDSSGKGRPQRLDVYTPSEPGPWPVVVVVHGTDQGKSTFAPLAEAIASEGAVVFNINVYMSFPNRTAIEEVACAVRFSRAMAADYGGDETRITLVGNSAGASTGAIVAMAGDDFAGDCVVTEGSALVDALVGYEGGYNIQTHNNAAGKWGDLREEDPELWKSIYPYSHIGGNPDLVVRLIHGDDTGTAWYEILLPRQGSVEFHQALVEAGYDAELTLLEGPHVALAVPSSKAFEVAVQQVLQVARG